MEDNFSVFYCTVCHVCKTSPKGLDETNFCSGCKLVQYCSKSHQRDDWPNHKELCKSIRHILKRTGTNHVYKEAHGFTKEDLVSWNNLRVSVMQLVELILKRSLSSIENQILLFPPVCNFCHRYEQNKMFSCASCNTVIYCSSEHQQSDINHINVCKSLNTSFHIDMLRLSKDHRPFYFSVSLNKLKMVNKLPQNIEYLLKNNDENLSNDEIVLSEPLSYCLTLIFAISKTNVTTNNLTVHIVGSDAMEVLAMKTFSIIFHFLPNLIQLNIVMVGPNLANNVTVPSEIKDKCSLCVVNTMLYHEYVISSSYTHPDVIAIFNCGFCEFTEIPEKDIWKKSLPFVLDVHKCTIVLTSYTEKEAIMDLNLLCKFKRYDVTYELLIESKINPFSSMYPHRDWEANHGDVFYVNKYISVLKT